MEMDDNPMVTVAASMPRVDIWVPVSKLPSTQRLLIFSYCTPSLCHTLCVIIMLNFSITSREHRRYPIGIRDCKWLDCIRSYSSFCPRFVLLCLTVTIRCCISTSTALIVSTCTTQAPWFHDWLLDFVGFKWLGCIRSYRTVPFVRALFSCVWLLQFAVASRRLPP